MDHLSAPWRMAYIRSLEGKPPEGSKPACFLCDAADADDEPSRRQRLVLWTTEHTIVMLNKFPYTSGHLLVSPKRHLADLCDLTEIELTELQTQTVRAVELLKQAFNPQGFNVGINLGRAAGAGLPGHLHQHIVPRWNGDTNFMSVVGTVRIHPQTIEQVWTQLDQLHRA
jgi:ATP adenylyltransferase